MIELYHYIDKLLSLLNKMSIFDKLLPI